jgi:ABC-type uncharacterized transport system substrate-binding protein
MLTVKSARVLTTFDQMDTCWLLNGCVATPVGSEVHPYVFGDLKTTTQIYIFVIFV